MENRRPPQAKSPGRNFDRSRGKPSFRGGPGGSGPSRGRRPDGDGRYGDPGRGGSGYQRRDGGPRGNSGKKFGDNSRFGKSGPGRDRGKPGKRDRVENEIKIVSDSQITDGKFRGHTLQNSVSPNSVHTQRKLREIAFKILARRVKAGRILDLGAACGTIGIEALSRGAMLVTFVERSARLCSYLRKNLEALGIKNGHGELVEMEILPFLIKSARRRRNWDLVYLDLPVDDGHAAILEYLSRGSTIKPTGLLIIQHASSTSYPDNLSKLTRWRTVDQGETILTMYERM